MVLLPSFSAEAWLAAARDEQVTHAFVVPTMLARIVAALEADAGLAVPSLRSLAYGGARMPRPVLERALRLFPDTGFTNAYGLTETSSTIAVLGPDEHRSGDRLGSVGRPVDGIEVRIASDDGPGDEDRPGEIWVRGPQVAGDYVGAPSKTDGEGWLHTGDLGWMDHDGYLFVTGRADDLIIRGGENIAPSEVEDMLMRHPAVAGAAVVGLADEEWGERVGAMVVLRAGATLDGDELFRWARQRLGSLKAPEVILLTAELPTTATGKVLHRDVRSALERAD
jgi:acyl-CoA synthetase (AMP-forming)/AMP-acid ligase II